MVGSGLVPYFVYVNALFFPSLWVIGKGVIWSKTPGTLYTYAVYYIPDLHIGGFLF